VNTLDALFPAEDFRFQLGLQRGDPEEFFRPKDDSGRLLGERRRWLAEAPERYAALRPGHERLLDATGDLLTAWGLSGPKPPRTLSGLGAAIEPDLLWLAADESGVFRLVGGVLCFPTGWALEDKIGQPMEFIHGPVPGLNAGLGSQIGQFLARMKPDAPYLRHNWGLAATAELNLHASLRRPRPSLPLDPACLWLRVEHQLLLALPGGGVLFAIRIELMEIAAVHNHATAAHGLSRALRSMPEAVAAYKGIAEIRLELADWLVA
jgi:hypothetical protein